MFEIKKGDLRVYAIKDEAGHIVILGGKKSTQHEDINWFRSIKKRYLESKNKHFMFTREEILRSPEYWFEEAQNELYRQVIEYKEKKEINQTQLAEELGVTKGYVSQILKGEFNYTLKKLIEISLAIGHVPKIEYTPLAKVIEDDRKSQFIQLPASEPFFITIPQTLQPSEETAEVAEPLVAYSYPVS